MRQFNQMKEAHISIYTALKDVENMLENIEENAAQIARGISRLAGTLKIHLANEDRYLYPTMLKSDEATLKSKVNEYQKEMGGLSQEFMTFKDKYNTTSKLMTNLSSAKKDITSIFKKIEERIQKEDHELYPLAEKIMY